MPTWTEIEHYMMWQPRFIAQALQILSIYFRSCNVHMTESQLLNVHSPALQASSAVSRKLCCLQHSLRV